MPAFCTHYILASEEMSNLHRIAAESGFKLCENAVYIGSQGPDIFFFHRTFPWQRESRFAPQALRCTVQNSAIFLTALPII